MAEDPRDQVTRLNAKIQRRKGRAVKYSNYYDGKHPLLFTSPEFSSVTGHLFEGFSDNWCQVVIDAIVERLAPVGFRLESGDLDDEAWRAWRRNECDVEIGLAFLESLVTSRAFGMVWKPNGVDTEITFLDISRAVVEYEPGRRNRRSAGLTVWYDPAAGLEFATLFRPDVVYRFERPAKNSGEWEDRRAGLAAGEPAHMVNPLGDVPIVELANRSRLRGKPTSEIKTVIPLQDTVNTIWAHLMTAADQLALPARAVLGMDRPTKDVLDPNTQEVIGEEDLPIAKFRSDRLLWLEGRDAKIAEFSAADLGNYTSVIETAVQHIAAQTRTPPHYLLGQMINVSADALVAGESGLVAKVTERQRYFGAAIRELMRLEALAAGDATRAMALSMGKIEWRDAQFRSDAQYADALTKFKAIGVPDEALWERIPGVDLDQIERWKSMRDDQAAAIVGGDIAGMFGPKPEMDEPAEATDEAA